MRLLLIAAAVLAVVVRVAFLADKPFWRDEAWVASLVGSAPTVVARPEHPRPLPLGFLAVTNLAARLPGVPPEVSYRLIPLVVGFAALPVLARLATALGAGGPTVVIAVWLAAGMPALVYYSRELKPYGFDLLFAALMPLLALRVLGRDAEGRPAGTATHLALLLVLAAAPWLTFGAVFPLLATLVWGWAVGVRTASPAARRTWLAGSMLFVASFAALHQLALSHQVASPRLRAAWGLALFADSAATPLAQVMDAVERYFRISTTYLFPTFWPAAAGFALVGLAAWPRRWRGFVAWLVVGPAFFTVAAALADRWVLAPGRLLLFAAPGIVLLASAGLARVGALAGRGGVVAAVALAIAASGWWSTVAVRHRLPPYHSDVADYFFYDILHDVDAAVAAAGPLVPPNEPLFVSLYASKQFAYYGRGRLAWATMCLEPCPTYWDDLPAFLRGVDRRGWILLIDEEAPRHAELATQAGLTHTLRAQTRGTQLWELTRGDRTES